VERRLHFQMYNCLQRVVLMLCVEKVPLYSTLVTGYSQPPVIGVTRFVDIFPLRSIMVLSIILKNLPLYISH